MIRLEPELETLRRSCPYCGSELTARGWLIPGMRNLGDYRCGGCGSEFWGDLPSGQGLYTPALLDKNIGSAVTLGNAPWFSRWMEDSFTKRASEPVGFEVKQFSKPKTKAILLNCLDALYGHSLLKLLNAQHYIDHEPDASLIVMVPSVLEWMIPEGVAEAWIVDLPLKRGIEWNDWLAMEVAERLRVYPEVHLSFGFSHPHGSTFEIERFTRVNPFPLGEFGRGRSVPVVTFIWRDDRLWESGGSNVPPTSGRKKWLWGPWQDQSGSDQTRKIVQFAEKLRAEFPALDFAVAGFGETGGLPEWVSDLRMTRLNADAERSWCKRYAASHIVVGVHGSNMLLPSAHSWGVIELISEDRWGNYLQDILFRESDPREMFFRYRFVPHSTGPEELSKIASTMLRYRDFQRLMGREFCDHQKSYDLEQWICENGS